MTRKDKDVFVGIDIGTTKICTVVSKKNLNGDYEIKAIGTSESSGLRKGTVINMEKTINSIKKSVQEANDLAKVSISRVDISIAGSHIFSFNNSALVATRSGEVTSRDIKRVIGEAQALDVPTDRKILHIIPQEFSVDDTDGIKNPIGMSGDKLGVSVHIVTGAITAIKNLVRCVEQAGVQVGNVVLQPMASSESVLSDEEKEMGVTVIDIGGGTTDIAIWKRGSLIHSQIIPIGGNHFTNDLALALKIPTYEAEKLKIDYGQVIQDRFNQNLTVKVRSLSGPKIKEVFVEDVTKILRFRAEEMFEVVKTMMKQKKLEDKMSCGVVLTGGGSLIKSIPVLGEFILEKPVKLGIPKTSVTSDAHYGPQMATALGLMALDKKKGESYEKFRKKYDLINKLNESLKNAFKDIF